MVHPIGQAYKRLLTNKLRRKKIRENRKTIKFSPVRDKSPVKSPNDKRDYRTIELNNGLKALLISDLPILDQEGKSTTLLNHDYNEELIAAAALCIGIGSFHDPEEIQGLAHLLEHVVFTGNNKYPVEHSFNNFLTQRGGFCDVSCGGEITEFYFDIQNKHLLQAFDIFVNCLITPLLEKDSLEKELQTLDIKFHENIKDDFWRRDQLLGSLTVKGHPLGKFMWGNYKSLKEIPRSRHVDVLKKLKEFHSQYYSAQYMTLAIEAAVSLDTLEEWVEKVFGLIPNNGLSKPSIWTSSETFHPDSYLKIYKTITEQQHHTLEITWALPSLNSFYRSKPQYYLSYLINHKGRNGLIFYLKEKLLALKIRCRYDDCGFEYTSGYSLFSIILKLTDEGYACLFEVILDIFQYLKMLRQVGPDRKIFDEIQSIANNGFYWQERINCLDYVETLCENMQYFPSEDYLTGDILLHNFDKNIIRQCLQMMTYDKAILTLQSKNHKIKGTCYKVEPWFGMLYGVYDIESDWLTSLSNIVPNSLFSFPERNPYIAYNFQIKPKNIETTDFPKLILNTEYSRLWYKTSTNNFHPIAYVEFYLISPLIFQSVQNYVLFETFIHLLKFNVMEVTHNAKVAKLNVEFTIMENGLLISIWGFDDKLYFLFEDIINHICIFNISEKVFDIMKIDLFQAYLDILKQPQKIAKDLLKTIIKFSHFNLIDKLSTLKQITKNMLLEYAEQFKSNLLIEGLIQGNITSKEALKYEELLWSKMNCSELPKIWPSIGRILQLPGGCHYCKIKSFNKYDSKSVIFNYYQIGISSVKKICLVELIICFMKIYCLSILKTELGYDINCRMTCHCDILGFMITVQIRAVKFNVYYINNRIEYFLHETKDKLKNLSKEKFSLLLNFLISKKVPDFNDSLKEIIGQKYMFDHLNKEIEYLNKIKLKDVITWYNDFLGNTKYYRKLSIQIIGGEKYEQESDVGYCSNSSTSKSKSSLLTECNVELIKCLDSDIVNKSYKYIFVPMDIDGDKHNIIDIEQFKLQLTSFPYISSKCNYDKFVKGY